MTKLTAQQVADIAARRERGQGYDYIAEVHGVSAGAVHYHCLKQGAVSPRQRKRPVPVEPVVRIGAKRTQRCFTVAEDAELMNLVLQGVPEREFCAQLNRARTSVRMRIMHLSLLEDISA